MQSWSPTGHSDHLGDAVAISTAADTDCSYLELALYCGKQGAGPMPCTSAGSQFPLMGEADPGLAWFIGGENGKTICTG